MIFPVSQIRKHFYCKYSIHGPIDQMLVSPPRFICWNLISKVMVLGGGGLGLLLWLCHHSGALTNEINALVKETPLFLWPREVIAKREVLEPGSRLSLDIESVSALILDFPASQTVRNKYGIAFYNNNSKGVRHIEIYALSLKV